MTTRTAGTNLSCAATIANATRWWWVRHAPVINPSRAIYGQGDVEADTSDRAAYESLARLLPEDPVWMHSSLARTRQTGEAVLAVRRTGNSGFITPDFVIEPDFMEQDFGDWQGQSRQSVRETLDRPTPLWLAPAHFRPPNGESFIDMLARVGRGIEHHTRHHAGRDIVCFAHGGTIRAVLAYVMGIAPDAALGFQIDNLSITEVSYLPPAAPGGQWHWAVGSVNLPPLHGLRFNLPQA